MSRTPAGKVTIDAQVADWEGALSPVDGEEFPLGVLNHKDNLYLALVSHNQQVTRQFITRGLTFWLDPTGAKEQAIGLRFPTGLMGQNRPAAGINATARPEGCGGPLSVPPVISKLSWAKRFGGTRPTALPTSVRVLP